MAKHTTIDGSVSGTLHVVRGVTITDGGLIDDYAPREMHVIVDDNGAAYPYLYEDTAYNADEDGRLAPLKAEVWGDGICLGRNFSPDEGELERCGIKFALCGSAAL